MDIRDIQSLKHKTHQSLNSGWFDPKQLILIHTAAGSAVLLLQVLISFYLQAQIDTTGGLSGMGLRSILTTVQTILESGVSILLPFWQLGYVAACLSMARGTDAEPRRLLAGFVHFGPALNLLLLKGLVILGIGMACLYPSIMLFLITPLADPLEESLMPVLAQAQATGASEIVLDDATVEAMMQTLQPLIWFFLGLFLVIYVPLSYRLRMADLALMDDPRGGAFRALRKSARITKKNCLNILRLDLSFWWYYVAELMIYVICYGDSILSLLGVTLPFSDQSAFILFYALALVVQVVLYYLVKNQVSVTYAHAYEALAAAAPQSAPQPKQQPWTYE